MNHDTDTAPTGRNDDGVSLTDSVYDVSAYATMYVDLSKPSRFPIAHGDVDDHVDRPFWGPVSTQSDVPREAGIFRHEATDAFRDVAHDHIKPDDRSAFRIPYNSNDVPAVMVWSIDDEYMVVCDRDRVVVDVDDVDFVGVHGSEAVVNVVGMRTRRGSPKPVTVRVENDDGATLTVDPTRFRSVVKRGPAWVRDPHEPNAMKRGDT